MQEKTRKDKLAAFRSKPCASASLDMSYSCAAAASGCFKRMEYAQTVVLASPRSGCVWGHGRPQGHGFQIPESLGCSGFSALCYEARTYGQGGPKEAGGKGRSKA